MILLVEEEYFEALPYGARTMREMFGEEAMRRWLDRIREEELAERASYEVADRDPLAPEDEGWQRNIPTHLDFIEDFEQKTYRTKLDYIREFISSIEDYSWEPYEDDLTEELCIETSRIVDPDNKWAVENQHGNISAYADARWAPYQFCLLAPRMVRFLLSRIDDLESDR